MLTCFIMLYTDGKAWVAHKDSHFWDQAGLFSSSSSSILFTVAQVWQTFGKVSVSKYYYCISRTYVHCAEPKPLKHWPNNWTDAEKHYLALIAPQPQVQLPGMSSGVHPPAPLLSSTISSSAGRSTLGDSVGIIFNLLAWEFWNLNSSSRLPVACGTRNETSRRSWPIKHHLLSCKGCWYNASRQVWFSSTNKEHANGAYRVCSKLFYCIIHPEGKYCLHLAANNWTLNIFILQVTCPPDYRSWVQTVYFLFGTNWAKIFAVPMWSHVPIMQADESESNKPPVNTMNLVNVSSHKNVNI